MCSFSLLLRKIKLLQMSNICNTESPESPTGEVTYRKGKTCYTFRSSRPEFGVSVHFGPIHDFVGCMHTGCTLFPADGHLRCSYLVCISRSTVSRRTRSQIHPSLVSKILDIALLVVVTCFSLPAWEYLLFIIF